MSNCLQSALETTGHRHCVWFCTTVKDTGNEELSFLICVPHFDFALGSLEYSLTWSWYFVATNVKTLILWDVLLQGE